MAKHLAIFVGDYIEKILRGEKTIEGRFSIDKIVPYEQIKKGDEIYLKHSGGLVVGRVTVDNVLFYEDLDGEVIGKLRKEYTADLQVDDEFWKRKANSRYATLIFLAQPERFIAPVRMKKSDRRPWVVLEK